MLHLIQISQILPTAKDFSDFLEKEINLYVAQLFVGKIIV